jgi:Tfp pilus assembly protein PilF
MKFAASALPNHADAVAWLKEVEPLVMSGETLERLALAECWQTVARKSGDKSIDTKAAALTRHVADELRSQPMTPEVALSLACLQEAQGDLQTAEASYRKVLELKPGHAIALNNLAMLLAKRPDGLNEALDLAKQATSSGDANVVSFYDTLAFVRVQRKEYDAAIETLTAALKLKPDHVWCQIRLTDVLAQSGQLEKARAALEALEKGLPSRDALSAEMASRLADLRSRLAREHS